MTEIDAYWRNDIGGRWVDARDGRRRTLLDPATTEPLAEVALGDGRDVDDAVAAARSRPRGRASRRGPWCRYAPPSACGG